LWCGFARYRLDRFFCDDFLRRLAGGFLRRFRGGLFSDRLAGFPGRGGLFYGFRFRLFGGGFGFRLFGGGFQGWRPL